MSTKASKILISTMLALVVLVTTYWVASNGWNRYQEYKRGVELQIYSLKEANKQSISARAAQDSIINQQSSRLVALDSSILKQKDLILSIRQQNAKIQDLINRATPTQLDSFFTARYGK